MYAFIMGKISNIETNYITAPINVSLFPYDDIDEIFL